MEKPATRLKRRAEDRCKQRQTNAGNRDQLILTDAHPTGTYVHFQRGKNTENLCCCNSMSYDSEPTFPSIEILTCEGKKTTTTICALILRANNYKHKPDQKSKMYRTVLISTAHDSAVCLIVHLTLASAPQTSTETTRLLQ